MSYSPLSVAAYYIGLFAPRLDAYSAWTPNGWRPVRQPLTPQVVVDALTKKGPSISAYMIGLGSTSHVLAFDFDTENGLDQAYTLAQTMQGLGLVAYVETSRRGAHLWSPIDAPVEAKVIRRAARSLLESALVEEASDPHIEIRPGSDRVDADVVEGVVVGKGLGHPLRMPCMPHPKTGKTGQMFKASGETMGHTLADILKAVEQSPAETIVKRSGMWSPTIRGLPKAFRKTVEHGEDPYEDASASDILRDLWGVTNPRPGKAVRCPAHDDKNPSLSILGDDKRAICKTPGCVLNNDDHGRGTYELTTLAPGAGA
jgi:hypothetical protein